jgi:hypothetical protein
VVASDDVPEWMDDYFDEAETYGDEELSAAEDDSTASSRCSPSVRRTVLQTV